MKAKTAKSSQGASFLKGDKVSVLVKNGRINQMVRQALDQILYNSYAIVVNDTRKWSLQGMILMKQSREIASLRSQ